MNGDIFLRELAYRLKNKPKSEVEQILQYYKEAIDDRIEDGMTEKEAVAAMGNIDDIINNISGEKYFSQEGKDEFNYSQRADIKSTIKNNTEKFVKGIMNNVDKFAYEITKVGRNSYSTSNPIYYIEIDDSNTPIKIKPSSDHSIHVEYYSDEDYFYDINEGIPGELRIIKRKVKKRFSFDSSGSDNLYIFLPINFMGNIYIKTTNEKIDINSINVEKLVCHTTNDVINLNEVVVNDECELNTTNDIIKLNYVNFKNIAECRTTNDEIKLFRVEVGKSLKCSTSNDDINGSIVGYMEEFNIISTTTNGDNNVPNYRGQGEKELYFKTTNADIDIEFIP